jgi:hypothetical protein
MVKNIFKYPVRLLLVIPFVFSTLIACATYLQSTEDAVEKAIPLSSDIPMEDEAGVDELIAPREVAQHEEENLEVVTKKYEVKDKKWGKFLLKVEDYAHPSYAPITLNISVLCNDQIKMKVPREAPVEESLVKDLKVCSFEGHEYNKSAHTMKIKYHTQSEEFKPNDPICNEGWEQEFVISEACHKWSIR